MILQKTEQETDHMTPVAAHLNQLEDDLHMVFGYLSERLVQFMNCSCPTWTRGVFSPLLQRVCMKWRRRAVRHTRALQRQSLDIAAAPRTLPADVLWF